jgi:hypothetical protein
MTTMAPVMRGNDCVGFLLKRGPGGVEAYDREAQSIGTFASEAFAARAVLDAAQDNLRDQ